MDFINIHTHHETSGNHFQLINCFLKKFNDQDYPGKTISIGLHPWYIDDDYHNQLLFLEDLVKLPEVKAIGEAGLDKIKGPEWALQIKVFERQLDIAEKIGKPIIIHCVKAYNELLEIHKKYNPSVAWIVHGFVGNKQLAEQLSKKGIYISFGEALVKGHKKTVEAFINVKDEQIFLETDDNAQLIISEVYEAAAKIKNISVELLKEKIKHNFTYIFK